MAIKYSVLVLLLAYSSVRCNVTSTCGQTVICNSYLDLAIDMIVRAKYNIPTCNNCKKNQMRKDVDCADILQMGHNKSGVYEIWPNNRVTEGKALYVYCDMDTDGGGWTVIQRRGDFQTPKDYFFQDWESYKEGFGEVEKDFWLGNDNIFALTNQKLYSVRFDLEDFERNKKYATYDKFWIDDEDHEYTLHISVYTGDAGDSMITIHNKQKFSTKDRDNDSEKDRNCAEIYKGAWWYNDCHHSNLNGFYHNGNHESDGDGINWRSFNGTWKDSLAWTEIKLRPKNFKHTALESAPL